MTLLAIITTLSAGFALLFRKYYMPPEEPMEAPIFPPEPPKPVELRVVNLPPKRPTIDELIRAMCEFEGKPGDLNYQLNNPLNCRPSPEGYHSMYGKVEIIDTDTDPKYPYKVGKFAKFKDWDTGWKYAKNTIKLKSKNNPSWTLRDLIYNWAPPEDDNPSENYARHLSRRLGVDYKTFLLRDIDW